MSTATKFSGDIGPTCHAGETSPKSSPQICRGQYLLPGVTPASLSASPGSARAREITATSGRSSSELLRTTDPLGACLKMLLGTSAWGSTRCALTWKASATPAGRLLFRLVPSTRRTGATESGFWLTPDVPGGGRANPPEMSPTGRLPDGRKRQVGLEHQARMVERGFWPTPMASDGCKGGPAQRDGRGRPYLAGAVHLWPTPKASPSGPDFARRKRPGSGGDDLATAVARAFLPTPTASQEAKNSTLPPSQMTRDNLAGYLFRNGERGQLNPEWVEWLMGFPAGWTASEG